MAGVIEGLSAGGGGGVSPGVSGYGLLGRLIGVNMNITTDNTIPLNCASFIVRRITATNASISLTTAAGGVYTAASKGGSIVVAAGQVYSNLTSAPIWLDLTPNAAVTGAVITAGTLFLNLTTAAGGVYTAASKGGSIVVAAGQVYSNLTSATIWLDLTLNAAVTGAVITASTLFLNLTTAQGAAATMDVYVYGERIS